MRMNRGRTADAMNPRDMDNTSPSSVLDISVHTAEVAGTDCDANAGKKPDMKLLQPIIARQLRECRRLEKEVMADIANEAWKTRPADCSEAEVGSDWTPFQVLEWALVVHLNVCLSESRPAFVRRKSFVVLNQLLELIHNKCSLIASQDETDQSADSHQPQHLSEESYRSHNEAIVPLGSEHLPPMDIDPLSNEVARHLSEEASLFRNDNVINSTEKLCLPPMDIDPLRRKGAQNLSEESSLSHNDDVINSAEELCLPLMDIDPLSTDGEQLQTVAVVNSECNNGDSSVIADNAVVELHTRTPLNAAESSCPISTVATTKFQQNVGRDQCSPQHTSFNSIAKPFVPEGIDPPRGYVVQPPAFAEVRANNYHFLPEFNQNSWMLGETATVPHYGNIPRDRMESLAPMMYFSTTGLPKGTGLGYGAPNAPSVGVSNPYVAPPPNFSLQHAGHVFIPPNSEKITSVVAREDCIPTLAHTINGRLQTLVTFRTDTMYAPIDNISVLCRLNEWDPFWSNVSIGKIGATRPIDSTYPWTDTIATVGGFRLDTSALGAMALSRKQISSRRWINDEYAILLRMIPLDHKEGSKRRADCHIWPKGTFLQINGVPTSLIQRRQPRCNSRQWAGISDGLNIVPLIQNPNSPSTIEIFCYDDQSYVYCASLSQYRSVDHVLWRLTKGGSQERITVVPLDESKRRAVSFAKSLVTIDIDEYDGDNAMEEQGKFNVSLKCPISKSAMQIPVRGRNCSHRQVRHILCRMNECLHRTFLTDSHA
jgi:hypothetical protein